MKIDNISKYLQENINILDHLEKYLKLTRQGRSWVALCPFHQDTHPSLFISDEKKIFKCFACGAGGDLIKFEMLWNKCNWKEAVTKLNETYHLNIEFNFQKQQMQKNDQQKQMIELLNMAKKWYQLAFYSQKNQNQIGIFLKERQLNSEIIEKWEIGWAPELQNQLIQFLKAKGYNEAMILNSGLINTDQNNQFYPFFKNRLMFPIYDSEKDLVGFVGRTIGTPQDSNNPKYLSFPNTNLFNKSRLLFNWKYPQIKVIYQKIIYLVEGIIDAIKLQQQQVNAVALMGTNITEMHIKKLASEYTIIKLWLDGDQSGWNGTLKAAQILLKNKLNVQIVPFLIDNDPDKWIRENPQLSLPIGQEPLKWLLTQTNLEWTNSQKNQWEAAVKIFWKFASFKNQAQFKPKILDLYGQKWLSQLQNQPFEEFMETQPENNPSKNLKINQSPNQEELIMWILFLQHHHLYKIFQKHNFQFKHPLLESAQIYLKKWYNNKIYKSADYLVYLNEIPEINARTLLIKAWNDHKNNPLIDHNFINKMFDFYHKKQFEEKLRNLSNNSGGVDFIKFVDARKKQKIIINYVDHDWKQITRNFKEKPQTRIKKS